MSLYTDNASANRGACRQNCRRAYKVTDVETGKELVIDHQYVMSAADICMIDKVPELLDAGVQVWKIEGRGRSPEYVETVTRAYKETLLDVANGTYTEEKIAEYFETLKSVYNRDLSHGNYYLGTEPLAYSDTHGSKATKEKVALGVVKKYFAKAGVAEAFLDAGDLTVGDEVKILGSTTGVYTATIDELRAADQTPISVGRKGEIVTFPVTERVRENDRVYRWQDAKR
jgi:putative protease